MMNAVVKVYDGCKYKEESKAVGVASYEHIRSFKVEEIEDEKIFAAGFEEADEYKEYLILEFEDGGLAMFRNSHVDMFRG